jgi:hypothetical protein
LSRYDELVSLLDEFIQEERSDLLETFRAKLVPLVQTWKASAGPLAEVSGAPAKAILHPLSGVPADSTRPIDGVKSTTSHRIAEIGLSSERQYASALRKYQDGDLRGALTTLPAPEDTPTDEVLPIEALRVNAQRGLGMYDSALATIERVLAIRPDDPKVIAMKIDVVIWATLAASERAAINRDI